MSKVYVNDGVTIAQVMRDHLNTWSNKPCDFQIEDLGKEVPSLMIQQLASAEVKTQYINGSYIGLWNFAIYMRVSGEDTASRLDALSCLSECAQWLMEKDVSGSYVNLPAIDENRTPQKIEVTNSPSIAVRYDNGVEDYLITMSLEYKVRRN